MKVTNQLDQLINTYNEMFKRCYDALDPKATQAERNQLRDALSEYLKPEADGTSNKDSASRD